MTDLFNRLAGFVSDAVGTPWAFLAALALVVGWAVTGPLFHFSELWQLVINTSTTIITFLMIFLVQNTQNRDARALHLKVDALIKAIEQADNNLIRAEKLTDAELKQAQAELERASKESESQ